MMATTQSLLEPTDVYPVGAGSGPLRVIDVRAPVEFARGALPNSLNLPILTDSERHLVGIRYKEAGQQAAVDLGFELTSEAMSARAEAWRRAAAESPAAIACWRGGLRSELAQRFIGEPRVPRVSGGYKGLREHLLSAGAKRLASTRVLVVSGMTGTGKTAFLTGSQAPGLLVLDLEDLANHRGSAFGGRGSQPAQQTFENELFAKLVLHSGQAVLVEDESRRIGDLRLPEQLFGAVATGEVLVLEAPLVERVGRIHREYVLAPAEEAGPDLVLAELVGAVRRIRRRLGGELADRLLSVLDRLASCDEWRDVEAWQDFLVPLLEEYYDPLYERATARLARPVAARGDREELRQWLIRNV